MSDLTYFSIGLTHQEIATLEQIVATLQYADPTLDLDGCIKWIFVQGCNLTIEKLLQLGIGQCNEPD